MKSLSESKVSNPTNDFIAPAASTLAATAAAGPATPVKEQGRTF